MKKVLILLLTMLGLFIAVNQLYKLSVTNEPEVPELNLSQPSLQQELIGHVHYLSEEIGERNYMNIGSLEKSMTYIQKSLSHCVDEVSIQQYQIAEGIFSNIVGLKKSVQPNAGTIVIGAHYDTIVGTKGANDNASGVAALLEICRLVSDKSFQNNILFVGFANEEPPFFKTEDMGSFVFAKKLFSDKTQLKGMLSLETIGAYYSGPNTQKYPVAGMEKTYPNQANFIAFISNPESSALTKKIIQKFKHSTEFPTEVLIAPGSVEGVDFSDHWAFWQFGYAAVMVSDTAFFRYPHYHTHEDTEDKVNFESLTEVVRGLAKAIVKIDSEI